MHFLMQIRSYGIDSDDLPILTLDETREQVREGHERIIAWHLFTSANVHRENFLSTLREFTERQFLVLDESEQPIARLQEPNPPPFPNTMSTVHTECIRHMNDIRNRSNVLLMSVKRYGPDFTMFMSGCLVDIERVLQRIRNQLEVTLYQYYIHDDTINEEELALPQEIASAFLHPTYTIEVLEQSLQMLEKSKYTTPQN